jgi:cell division protein FtsB
MKESTKLRVINYFWIAVTVIIAICTIYVSIFTIRDTVRMKSQIAVLDEEIARYESKIESDSIFIENISNDPDFMESYARERYHMQRPGETVFILEE